MLQEAMGFYKEEFGRISSDVTVWTSSVIPAGMPETVRLRWRLISGVEVRVRVCQSPEAEGNCVATRRGGKQPEANDPSVGDELDSAG